jgi:hypothetical protein
MKSRRLLRAKGTRQVGRLRSKATRTTQATTSPLDVVVAEPTGHSRRARRWRVLAIVSLVAAVSALGAGLAFGLLATTGVGSGSATTGAVSVNLHSPASRVCAYRRLSPGSGLASQACRFAVAYAGSIPAFLSLSVLVETKAGPGTDARPLYDPATGSGLTLRIHDDQSPSVAYRTPTVTTACPPTAPAGSTCYQVDDELVSARSFTRLSPAVIFTLAPALSTSTGDDYQGGTATVVLSAQAVQAPANPLPATCNAATTGDPCPANGSFSWR